MKMAITLFDMLLLLLHPFSGLFSRTTWVSQYQKVKVTRVKLFISQLAVK